MQTSRKSSDTKNRKDKKEETKKPLEEKLRKSVYTISTPREYVSKTSASDIYAQKKVDGNAPKKIPGLSSTSKISPMKGLLKSSASSVSQTSRTDRTPKKLEPRTLYSTKSEAKSTHTTGKNATPRKTERITNVTVNSPILKKKLNLNVERITKESKRDKRELGGGEAGYSKGGREIQELEYVENVENAKIQGVRQRTKTRTLDESEVKIFSVDTVDNNAEMLNLSMKLVGKPKAFYVDFDGDGKKSKPVLEKEKSDDEISYEDDFESYESDFDSYHSDASEASKDSESEASSDAERSERTEVSAEGSLKEKDEERMLDSGNFDLRDQRSVRTKPAAMDFIVEDAEKLPDDPGKSIEDAKKSLDEGFQDMSSASSVRAVDILDRPLFLDLSKSKQNKTKRKFFERLNQRAKDLLAVLTLHEMTYCLYEMQPISYDLYMATFGRSNYTQSGVQTFDDGITEEIQTDEVTVAQKWTQYPVEFSKHDIFHNKKAISRKCSSHTEEYLTKFTFLTNERSVDDNNTMTLDENYKENPLRVFFEQKDGVGCDEMLPYEKYKNKLKSKDYNAHRLGRFLKKCESKISRILSKNAGSKDLTGLKKSGKLPFSKGYVTISPKLIEQPKYDFLKCSKITKLFFSETKSSLLMTVHKKAKFVDGKKSLVCLWDLSVAREPIKVLLTIDDIAIGKFKGNTDGIFVAALEDGSIHLWDLSEEPLWLGSVATAAKSPEIVEVESDRISQVEKDREWNLRSSKVGLLQLAIVYSTDGAKICYKRKTQSDNQPKNNIDTGPYPPIPFALQSCAYTNSALNINSTDTSDCIVGLEMMATQIVSLQRIGIITIWFIIQEKKTSKDIGKAFWSKMRLERHQTINLSDHIDTIIQENTNFNLNSAKRRITQRKQERNSFKKEIRPKTASKFDFDIDRPYSAASLRKKVLPVEINLPKSWENGIVCNDLRIINFNNVHSFLVAKNNGEVLCCKRCLGVLRIERFSVATDTSSITSLDVSCEGIPYFLAASDAGTVNLCSLLDYRVLLTLDCRNVPLHNDAVDKCQSDHKGRFVSSANYTKASNNNIFTKLEVTSVRWSRVNHCCLLVLLRDETLITFDLTHSDMNARAASDKTASCIDQSDHTLALLTPDGEVQIHKMANEDRNKEYLHLFNKYVALL